MVTILHFVFRFVYVLMALLELVVKAVHEDGTKIFPATAENATAMATIVI